MIYVRQFVLEYFSDIIAEDLTLNYEHLFDDECAEYEDLFDPSDPFYETEEECARAEGFILDDDGE